MKHKYLPQLWKYFVKTFKSGNPQHSFVTIVKPRTRGFFRLNIFRTCSTCLKISLLRSVLQGWSSVLRLQLQLLDHCNLLEVFILLKKRMKWGWSMFKKTLCWSYSSYRLAGLKPLVSPWIEKLKFNRAWKLTWEFSPVYRRNQRKVYFEFRDAFAARVVWFLKLSVLYRLREYCKLVRRAKLFEMSLNNPIF